MTSDSDHGAPTRGLPLTSSSTILVQSLVQALVADAIGGLEERVRAIVREEIRRGAAGEAEWLAPGPAAGLAGVSRATIRRWRAEGLLTRGLHGRVSVRELRALLARGDGAPPPPSDLVAERARRSGAAIKQRT